MIHLVFKTYFGNRYYCYIHCSYKKTRALVRECIWGFVENKDSGLEVQDWTSHINFKIPVLECHPQKPPLALPSPYELLALPHHFLKEANEQSCFLHKASAGAAGTRL